MIAVLWMRVGRGWTRASLTCLGLIRTPDEETDGKRAFCDPKGVLGIAIISADGHSWAPLPVTQHLVL